MKQKQETEPATKLFSVRFPMWLYKRVMDVARNEERSRNWIIRKSVTEYMGGGSAGDKPSEVDEV